MSLPLSTKRNDSKEWESLLPATPQEELRNGIEYIDWHRTANIESMQDALNGEGHTVLKPVPERQRHSLTCRLEFILGGQQILKDVNMECRKCPMGKTEFKVVYLTIYGCADTAQHTSAFLETNPAHLGEAREAIARALKNVMETREAQSRSCAFGIGY